MVHHHLAEKRDHKERFGHILQKAQRLSQQLKREVRFAQNQRIGEAQNFGPSRDTRYGAYGLWLRARPRQAPAAPTVGQWSQLHC